VTEQKEQKPLKGDVLRPAQAGDERLLAEFSYAIKAWVTHMTPPAKAVALEKLKKFLEENP